MSWVVNGSMKVAKCVQEKRRLLKFSMIEEPSEKAVSAIRQNTQVRDFRILNPVLPIMSRKDLTVPFQTVEAMLAFNEGKDLAAGNWPLNTKAPEEVFRKKLCLRKGELFCI